MAPAVLAEMGLDWDQMTVNTATPLPRRRLPRGVTALLWTLRVYVIVALPMIAYTFVHSLGQH